MKTAEYLLAIPATEPERLFAYDEYARKAAWRALAQRWHPDRIDGNNDVFQHVKALYELADKRALEGTWQEPGKITFNTVDGRVFAMGHKAHRRFDLGDLFIGNKHIIYSVEAQYADLLAIALRNIRNLKYKNTAMREEAARYMPSIHSEFQTVDRHVLVLSKNPELLPMREALTFYGGKLPPAHVAWIVSWAYAAISYLHYGTGMAHGDINVDTLFINPGEHSAAVLGGWWFSAPLGSRFAALPGRTVHLGAKASARHLTEQVRALGRELLGDVHGSKLLADKAVPPAMVLWLRGSGTGDVLGEYKTWVDKVLPSAFGKRRFVVMDLKAEDVYGRSSS